MAWWTLYATIKNLIGFLLVYAAGVHSGVRYWCTLWCTLLVYTLDSNYIIFPSKKMYAVLPFASFIWSKSKFVWVYGITLSTVLWRLGCKIYFTLDISIYKDYYRRKFILLEFEFLEGKQEINTCLCLEKRYFYA